MKQGHSVYFASCVLLVQRLLLAKAELWLEKELKRLDRFEALIVDDLGYVQQSRDQMEVLFTLLAHRYERRSVLLTSNLVFSEWERIFKDPMTTAAAVDRLVDYSAIQEMISRAIAWKPQRNGSQSQAGTELQWRAQRLEAASRHLWRGTRPPVGLRLLPGLAPSQKGLKESRLILTTPGEVRICKKSAGDTIRTTGKTRLRRNIGLVFWLTYLKRLESGILIVVKHER